MSNPATLRPPWRAGQSGNPSGRARGELYISECVRILLRGGAPPENPPPVWEVAANILRCLREDRLDARVLNIVLDRLEGKVPDKLELNAQTGVVILPAARLDGAEWSALARATLRAGAVDAEEVSAARPAPQLEATGDGPDGRRKG